MVNVIIPNYVIINMKTQILHTIHTFNNIFSWIYVIQTRVCSLFAIQKKTNCVLLPSKVKRLLNNQLLTPDNIWFMWHIKLVEILSELNTLVSSENNKKVEPHKLRTISLMNTRNSIGLSNLPWGTP